jgi:hypothetical protein
VASCPVDDAREWESPDAVAIRSPLSPAKADAAV